LECCDFFGSRTNAVANGEHFVIFYGLGPKNWWGCFWTLGAKAKRRGKNNHFYNAKSEAEATGNSNSLQSASGKMSDLKVTR